MAGRGRQSTLPAWLTEAAANGGPPLVGVDREEPSAADRFADAAFAAVGRPVEDRDRERSRGGDRDRNRSR